jgi:hypothetical protein
MKALKRGHDGYTKVDVPQDRIWLHDDSTDEGFQIRLDKDSTIYISYRNCSMLVSKIIPLKDFVDIMKGLVK